MSILRQLKIIKRKIPLTVRKRSVSTISATVGRSVIPVQIRQRRLRSEGRPVRRASGSALGLVPLLPGLAHEGEPVGAHEVVPLDPVRVPVVEDGQTLLSRPVEALAEVVGLGLVHAALGGPVAALDLASRGRPVPVGMPGAGLLAGAEPAAGPEAVEVI